MHQQNQHIPQRQGDTPQTNPTTISRVKDSLVNEEHPKSSENTTMRLELLRIPNVPSQWKLDRYTVRARESNLEGKALWLSPNRISEMLSNTELCMMNTNKAPKPLSHIRSTGKKEPVFTDLLTSRKVAVLPPRAMTRTSTEEARTFYFNRWIHSKSQLCQRPRTTIALLS